MACAGDDRGDGSDDSGDGNDDSSGGGGDGGDDGAGGDDGGGDDARDDGSDDGGDDGGDGGDDGDDAGGDSGGDDGGDSGGHGGNGGGNSVKKIEKSKLGSFDTKNVVILGNAKLFWIFTRHFEIFVVEKIHFFRGQKFYIQFFFVGGWMCVCVCVCPLLRTYFHRPTPTGLECEF